MKVHMNHRAKIGIVVIAAVVAALLFFSLRGPKQDPVVGSWRGEQKPAAGMEFRADGTLRVQLDNTDGGLLPMNDFKFVGDWKRLDDDRIEATIEIFGGRVSSIHTVAIENDVMEATDEKGKTERWVRGEPLAPNSNSALEPLMGGGSNKLDMTYLPDNTEMVMHLKVADVWKSDLLADVRNNPMVAGMIGMATANIGDFSILDIETVTLGVPGLAKQGQQPNMDLAKGIAVFRLSKDLNGEELVGKFPFLTATEHGGKSYYKLPGNEGMGVWFADSRTVVFSLKGYEALEKAIDSGGSQSRFKRFDMIEPDDQLVFAIAPENPALNKNAFDKVPDPKLESLVKLMNEFATRLAMGLKLTDGVSVSGGLKCKNSDGATQIKNELERLRAEFKQEIERKAVGMPPQAALAIKIFDAIKLEANGSSVAVNAQFTAAQIQELKQSAPGGLFGGASDGGAFPDGAVNFPNDGGLNVGAGVLGGAKHFGNPIKMTRSKKQPQANHAGHAQL